MKQNRILKCLLVVASILCTCSMWGADYDFRVDHIYYSIISETNYTVEVVDFSGNDSGVLDIPDVVDYNGQAYSVVSIGSRAFSFTSSITSVSIGNNVTTIGNNAFYHCSNLATITFGSSVTTIGEYAFYENNSLTSVSIPDCVKTIDSNAFSNCTGLTSITIGNGVTEIGMDAFYDCSALTTVTIGKSVTSIGKNAFRSCTSLTSVNIPDNVTSIAYGTFEDCTSLTSVTIGNSVTSIGAYAFKSCKKLTSVDIPENVISIDNEAFSSCTSITSITIPKWVTYLGLNVFQKCTKLREVTYNAIECTTDESPSYPIFEGCTAIRNITIGDSVKSIPSYSFRGCTGLTKVVSLNSTPPTLTSNVFNSYDIEAEVPLDAVVDYMEADIWPNIPVIYAVKNGKNYYPAQISREGTSIIKFKDGSENGTVIGEDERAYIFPKDGKDNLLGKVMYNGKNLTAALIGEGICSFEVTKYHADNVVYSYYVDSDQEYDVSLSQSGTLADVIGVNNINNVYSLRVSGDINGSDILAIRKYPNLKYLDISHANIVRGGSAYYDTYETYYDEVGDYFFYDLTNLNLLKLPDSATSIGKYAFASCSNLFCINISSSATSIGAFAFQGCSGLIGINAKNATPPAVATGDSKPYDTNPFGAINVDNCVLNVPIGSGSAYWLDTYWGVFYDINEVDFDNDATGIDDILASDETSTLGGDIQIYDISGRRVNTPIKGNVYIFRYPDSTTKKIIVE